MHHRNGKSLEQSQNWRSKRLDRLVEAASAGDYGGWAEIHDSEHHINGQDEVEDEDDEKPTQEEEDELRDEINEDLPDEDDQYHFEQFGRGPHLTPKVYNSQQLLKKSATVNQTPKMLQVQGSPLVGGTK